MSTSIGRNDPCHCGSGKKFKHCHGGPEVTKKEADKIQWSSVAILVALMALGLGGAATAMLTREPAAKVGELTWSKEHAHWHDAKGKQMSAAAYGKPLPEPPGQALPGQVWNGEHGHYHGADGKELPQIGH